MIFHEIYSAYYLAVEQMIALALENKLSKSSAWDICNRLAFRESFELIWTALSDEEWRVLPFNSKLPYRKNPDRPLSLLEKRWLKAIMADPRIRLFNCYAKGLDDVDPLFTPDDWYTANTYSDGDPYDSPEYASVFRTVLQAVKEQKWLSVDMINQYGKASHVYVLPQTIEYAKRDDKFRVLCSAQSEADTINIGRIICCSICSENPVVKRRRKKEEEVYELVLAITDTRNGLERVMTHFSTYDKSLRRQADDSYQLTLRYHPDEESDLLLQVLSFGPIIHVLAPERFKNQLLERLRLQLLENI